MHNRKFTSDVHSQTRHMVHIGITGMPHKDIYT